MRTQQHTFMLLHFLQPSIYIYFKRKILCKLGKFLKTCFSNIYLKLFYRKSKN